MGAGKRARETKRSKCMCVYFLLFGPLIFTDGYKFYTGRFIDSKEARKSSFKTLMINCTRGRWRGIVEIRIGGVRNRDFSLVSKGVHQTHNKREHLKFHKVPFQKRRS
jgi:hypothetical protein